MAESAKAAPVPASRTGTTTVATVAVAVTSSGIHRAADVAPVDPVQAPPIAAGSAA